MLYSLTIKNMALIDDISIEFKKSLNILTGQTGSGKSIIIDSLNFLLGSRSDKTLIRSGKTQAYVKGVFYIDSKSTDLKAIFDELMIEFDNTIILERTMSIENSSVFSLNGEILPVSKLRNLFNHLIVIHSQNDFGKSFSESNIMKLIDLNAGEGFIKAYKSYISLYNKLKDLNNDIDSIGGTEEERLKEIDLLSHEISEIDAMELIPDIDNKLREEFSSIFNHSKIVEKLSHTSESLDGNNDNNYYGVLRLIKQALSSLSEVSRHNSELDVLEKRLEQVLIELDDINSSINIFASSIEYDENKLKEIDEKIDRVNSLKRKYGGSIDSVLEYRENAAQRLDILNNSKERLIEYKEKKKSLLNDIMSASKNLTKERMHSAKMLEIRIIEELEDLGMGDSTISFNFNDYSNFDNIRLESVLRNNGADMIEVLFSANKGEPVKPILKVISGGELSRLVLTIKTIMAINSSSTLIFDEIDTGMSGEIALSIGKKFAKISKYNQVLAVSHLPQVSAMADNNIYIYKKFENNKTSTNYKIIDGDDLAHEVARMLSGSDITDSNLMSAKELLDFCSKYKKNISEQ